MRDAPWQGKLCQDQAAGPQDKIVGIQFESCRGHALKKGRLRCPQSGFCQCYTSKTAGKEKIFGLEIEGEIWKLRDLGLEWFAPDLYLMIYTEIGSACWMQWRSKRISNQTLHILHARKSLFIQGE